MIIDKCSFNFVLDFYDPPQGLSSLMCILAFLTFTVNSPFECCTFLKFVSSFFFQRGFSALMYAVQGNHLHVVKELVLSQAELKIRDKVCM